MGQAGIIIFLWQVRAESQRTERLADGCKVSSLLLGRVHFLCIYNSEVVVYHEVIIPISRYKTMIKSDDRIDAGLSLLHSS